MNIFCLDIHCIVSKQECQDPAGHAPEILNRLRRPLESAATEFLELLDMFVLVWVARVCWRVCTLFVQTTRSLYKKANSGSINNTNNSSSSNSSSKSNNNDVLQHE